MLLLGVVAEVKWLGTPAKGVQLEATSASVRYDIKKSFNWMASLEPQVRLFARRVLGES